jgi:hypothetical protein
MSILWEHSFWVFFFLTVVIAGGAAAATGRALARQWRSYWLLVFYVTLLGCADRFLHWGLFLDAPLDVYKGDLLSVHYYLVDTAILLIFASLAYRLTRVRQMTTQYRWLYERAGPLSWRKRASSPGNAES